MLCPSKIYSALLLIFVGIATVGSNPRATEASGGRQVPRRSADICLLRVGEAPSPLGPAPPTIVLRLFADAGSPEGVAAQISVRPPNGATCVALQVQTPGLSGWSTIGAGSIEGHTGELYNIRVGLSGNCYRTFAANEFGRSAFSGEVCVGDADSEQEPL